MTTVLVFGSENDPQAWGMIPDLKRILPAHGFVRTEDPEDLMKVLDDDVVILDVAEGISKPRVVAPESLARSRPSTLHDMDLGTYIQLLREIGKLDSVTIVGIPRQGQWTREVAELLDRQ